MNCCFYGGFKSRPEKLKGCDIGYALAAYSCEGVQRRGTCTVTAPDAITTFVVPSPGPLSQACRFFRAWQTQRVASLTLTTQPTSDWPLIRKPTLSAVDEVTVNSPSFNVNARDLCNCGKLGKSQFGKLFLARLNSPLQMSPGVHGNIAKTQVFATKGEHPAVATDKSNPMMRGTQGK